MNIGSKIRELRIKHNLTENEFAKLIKVNKSTIIKYEENMRKPRIYTLFKIARYFNVTFNYLLSDE
jgi:transcriptional regulator with XRE-family HTH domain